MINLFNKKLSIGYTVANNSYLLANTFLNNNYTASFTSYIDTKVKIEIYHQTFLLIIKTYDKGNT